ncbi:MAG TPA: hypothetical protein VHX64_17340 [Caulobacteraceae bacterium]|nr:hypothetical protein [Caulobacteraceae bacterium]
MRATWRFAGVVMLAAMALAGCGRSGDLLGADHGHTHGRYAGIGIYTPGQPWARMVAAQQAKDSPSARTIDDQAIIVTVDSVTGEVRGCGDLSGYCVGMNPWKTPLAASQQAPIALTGHARQIDPDAAESSAPASSSTSQ